jgi:hypothetical protein
MKKKTKFESQDDAFGILEIGLESGGCKKGM